MKINHSIFSSVLLCLCLLLTAGTAFAQGTNLGTIRGTVTDANGAVVAGAKVQVTDLETSLTRDVTANSEGNYEVTGLQYGAYKLTVTAQGFKTATVNQVALRSGDTVRADVELQTGGTTETVEVVANTPINLETPTVSGQLTSREIIELPRDNRDIYSFLYLNPNITQGAADGAFKFIGAQSYGASFSLDGQRSNGGIFGEPTSSQPSFETIGELVVLSNNFSAEYAGIANIRVTTKRGGKDYTGSLFYNNKNSALAAWPIGDKQGEATFTPTPALSKFPTPYFNLNETGGSFGGPVPFGKEKTFFLASYERRWNASPVRFRSTTLPHASLYAGDFTKVNDSIKPVVPAGITLTQAEIDANTILTGTTRRFKTIPSRLLNPTTQAFIKNYFPVTSVNAPINAANGRLMDFFENRTGLVVRDLGTLRVDHDLSSKDKLSAVYNTQFVDQSTAAVVSPYVGLGLRNDDRSNHTLSLSHTRIFSSNVVNEARGGFNFQFLFRNSNTTPTSFLESIGFDSSDIAAYYAVVGENARPTFGHVGLSFSNSFATFGTGGRNTFRPLDQKLYTFGDTLTWVTGRHTIKGGFDIVRNSAQDGFANNRGNPRGLLTYSTGSATDRFTSFLLGLPATTATFVDNLRPPMDVYNWEHGYFAQDDFKIHPRLTLFLGLRYELITPFIERNDLLVNFDPDFKDSTGKRGRFIVPSREVLGMVDPRIIAFGVATADQVGVGRGLVKTDTNNLAPRLGAAWRLTEKTVFRGGYGVFYPTAAAQGIRDAIATNPFNQGRTKSNATTSLAGWPGGANGRGISPFSNGTLRTIGSQPSANAVPIDLRQPRIEQYNATFERELPWQTALRVSYLGTRSKGLIAGIDLNMIPPSDTPFGTTTGDGITPCTPGDDCDLSPADLARLPFPQLGDFLLTYGNLGRGKSHALQVEANRRFAGGFTFNASYTLLDQKSSALDTGNSSLGGTSYNQFKPDNDFGTDGFVSRHRFIAYGIIEVPFGRGRKFGSSAPTATELIAGGWQVSWNMFAKSGYGFTPYWECDNCGPALPGNVASTSLDAVGGFANGTAFRPIVTGSPNQKSGDRFFNPDAFGMPPLGADVFDNPNVAKRNLLKGPGAWGANLGLNKSFRFGERFRLRFGAEFNNVFNHPLRPPAGDNSVARLGSFGIKVNPANRRVEIDTIDPNLDFGRFFDSFSQENIDSRRAVRITLRLTF
ncbi:MAG: carboxypeptidase regulatory-like domain-containing protein [Blastocatellia bacterium]